MAAKVSGGIITFAVINIVIALLGPCTAFVGLAMTFSEPRVDIKGRDVGPELRAHLQRKVPGAKVMSVITLSGNCLSAFLLLTGAIGLLLGQAWGRSVTISAAVFFILLFCIHDAYQFGLYVPAYNEFLDLHTRGMPGGEGVGFKFGMMGATFCWPCSNFIVIFYLAGMTFHLSTLKKSPKKKVSRDRRPREVEDEDEDYEARPRRRRRDVDDRFTVD